MKDEKKPGLAHLEWLIESRHKNNQTAHKLLSLFEIYPAQIRTKPCFAPSQILVAVAFSLWRAAFLSETKGITDDRTDNAENFLRKMLADNAIGFSQDLQWREWAVNYYLTNALFNLRSFEKGMKAGLGPLNIPAGGFASKSRWAQLHSAFEIAVAALEKRLLEMPAETPTAVAKKR